MLTPIRTLLIEANRPLREGLFQLINGSPGFSCVGAFSDATDIVFNIQRCLPNVILMDIDSPDKSNGIEAAKLVHHKFPDISIIIQTAYEDRTNLYLSIKSGASGFLLKKTPPIKVLDAIQEVANGGAPMSPSIASIAIQMFREITNDTQIYEGIKSSISPPSLKSLTERQKEVLAAIVEGKSYKTIAKDLFISVDTVRFHVKKIYELLQVHSKYELMVICRKS